MYHFPKGISVNQCYLNGNDDDGFADYGTKRFIYVRMCVLGSALSSPLNPSSFSIKKLIIIYCFTRNCAKILGKKIYSIS